MGTVRYQTINGEILSEIRGGVRKQYIPDPLGSTVALADSTGAITDTFEYWPYGEVRTKTGASVTPFQYLGVWGYYRDGFSRTYVRARTLRTDLAMWLTEDPLRLAWLFIDNFLYCDNNPMTMIDRSGLSPECDDRDCFGACWPLLLGVGGSGGAVLIGQGTISKPFITPNASEKTSLISKYLSKWLPYRLKRGFYAPTLKRGLITNKVVGRIIGRWVPVFGWVILGYDLNQFLLCMYECDPGDPNKIGSSYKYQIRKEYD